MTISIDTEDKKLTGKVSISKVYEDLRLSVQAFSKLFQEMETDFEFAQGKQWENEDLRTLEAAGVKGLTINKIRPMIKLITGIERQSRSDIVAFPEGGEDTITAEIVTKLLKNIVKRSDADRKLSSQFKNGVIGGVRYLEPYIDYSFDIINGEMKLREISGRRIFLDPDGTEYDLSDRRFIIKLTTNLSREDVLQLFPEKEGKLEQVSMARVDTDHMDNVVNIVKREDYPSLDGASQDLIKEKEGFDLLEYYYKRLVDRYFVADPSLGTLQEVESKERAEEYVAQFPDAKVIKKKTPEIRLKQIIGDVEFTDEVAWTYPNYKGYPIIPFFAELTEEDIKDKELLIQGVVRGIRDLQTEYNKRRTQELRHLNSTVNSGWWVAKDSLSNEHMRALHKFGSSPGFVGEVDLQASGGNYPQRINPSPLSQGHAQLAAENAQDIKEASGVNPDLLANESQSQSGRAILLKQRQGLVMVQEALDNYSFTKRILGRFLVSQLSEVFTVESAIRVLGEAYIQENFNVPAKNIYDRAIEKQQSGQSLSELEQTVMLQFDGARSDIDFIDETIGQPIMVVDVDESGALVNQVLNDSSLSKFDVSVGEGVYNETVRLSEFLTAKEMAAEGLPIPADVLVELSTLPEASKGKIIRAIEQQRNAIAQQG